MKLSFKRKKNMVFINKKEKPIIWKVYINKNYYNFFIKGTLGVTSGNILNMAFIKKDNMLFFFSKKFFYLFIAQIKNMIAGVLYGYFLDMFLKGIGYRVFEYEKVLYLNIGYTHDIRFRLPENILVRTLKNQLLIFGINNILLNNVGFNILKFKVADVYRGKGVRFVDKDFRMKLGKQR